MGRVTCHKNKTVSYWSVYKQVWIRRARWIPDAELAAMSPRIRARVIAHLGL
jgi:hypothetical protein